VNVVELHDVSKRFDNIIAVDHVSFILQKGRIISLLGPSGCGKTTTLRIIAGFEKPDSGSVLIGGANVTQKPPYERNVGLVFQDYALFPHMTVEENVGYGLRRRKHVHRGIGARIEYLLDLTKLAGLNSRYPSQLSGGQQQRVALARALATDPEVMLLDEPLSALDAKLRLELRLELKEVLHKVGAATVIVTHDQDEALSLGESVIVMNRGRIVQSGTPTEIYARPRSRFVAEFIGQSNWFDGHLEIETSPGIGRFLTTTGERLFVSTEGCNNRACRQVCIRPERIRVEKAHGSFDDPSSVCPINCLSGMIVDVAHIGSELQITIQLTSGHRLSAVEKFVGQDFHVLREQVAVRFHAQDCMLIPEEGA
jgi:ABC-type Fe3+/spermidine/putrescine transport system ATPase subunit